MDETNEPSNERISIFIELKIIHFSLFCFFQLTSSIPDSDKRKCLWSGGQREWEPESGVLGFCCFIANLK